MKFLSLSSVLHLFVAALMASSIFGCTSSRRMDTRFLYFQHDMDSIENVQSKEVLIKSNDLLGITIFSKSINQEQAAIFNLPNGANNSGYLVGNDGTIEVPLIDHVPAAGLTKAQLEESLQIKLATFVKNPSVIVVFSQFKVNVLGEVKSPGIISFNKDHVTILDAISASGDLTDFGKRTEVTVIREENNLRKAYSLNLQSGKIFQSPAYLLQPGDVVYVSANNKKLRSLELNPERGRGFQLFATVFSVTVNFAFLIYTISKNK